MLFSRYYSTFVYKFNQLIIIYKYPTSLSPLPLLFVSSASFLRKLLNAIPMRIIITMLQHFTIQHEGKCVIQRRREEASDISRRAITGASRTEARQALNGRMRHVVASHVAAVAVSCWASTSPARNGGILFRPDRENLTFFETKLTTN